jgi:hypothetical protein
MRFGHPGLVPMAGQRGGGAGGCDRCGADETPHRGGPSSRGVTCLANRLCAEAGNLAARVAVAVISAARAEVRLPWDFCCQRLVARLHADLTEFGRLAGGPPCPGKSRRLCWCGMLAHGATRTGWPVRIGAVSTPAAARKWRRPDKTPAWVWPSSRWHRLGAGAGAGSLERGGGGCLPRRTTGARC